MKINKRINGYSLVSPVSVVILTGIIFSLSMIDNPMNWVANYNWSGDLDYNIIACYMAFLILGMIVGKLFCKSVRSENQIHFDFKINAIFVIFFLSCLFQFAKFVNIGDIPLLGDPSSRYRLTLGGFEDYPSRLLAPLSCIFFHLFLKSRKFIYLTCVVIAFTANLMLLQRQEILNVALGCLIVYIFSKKISLFSVLLYALVSFISLYLLIGVGAILRFGADNLLTNSNIFLLPLYVLHADMTTAIIFGQSIVETLGERTLNGAYAFGSYISIFIPGFTDHGAELVRKEFTSSATAQSLGVPFAYFVDFGYISLTVLAFLKGFVLQYFFNKAHLNKKLSDIIFYIIIYLNALWALRAGTLIITPICLYVGVFIIFAKNAINTTAFISIRKIAKLMFIFSLLISFTALAIRI